MLSDCRSLYEVVAHWAARQPSGPAFVADGRAPMTYGTLLASVDAFREILNAAGFGRGDRLAIVHAGGPDMAVAIVGVWGCATAVPLSHQLTAGEYAIRFRDLRIDALMTDVASTAPAVEAADGLGLPVIEIVPGEDGIAGSITLRVERAAEAERPGPPENGDIATILTTSGTTSHSKIVPLHHRVSLRHYENYRKHHDLVPGDRCLNLMPLFHGHGLNLGLGTSLYMGGSMIMLPDFSIDTFERYIDVLEPTWYTGAYTFHHQIAANADRLAPVLRRSKVRFTRSGSGRLDGQVAEVVENVLGVPMMEAYSSSETGIIATNPPPPGLRKRGSVGIPIEEGTCVVDEHGHAPPVGVTGEVVIPQAYVFGGYENDPDANAAAFRGDYYHTGDAGYFDEDGYLFLTGRIKELINRGGEKITPMEIETALCALPGVRAAAAFAIPHPTLGEEVAAAVEVEREASLTESGLTSALRKTLADFKIPRRYAFVDEIPKGPTGRVVRRTLAAELGLDQTKVPVADRPSSPNRRPTALEAQLQSLWAETLRLDDVGLDDDFFLLGGDSLQAVELFLRIEQALDCRLPRAILFEAGTVSAMAKKIAEYNGSPCLVRVSPEGDRPPFFCIHGGDGNAVYFRNLARYLGPSQPFYALQSVGLDGLEEPLTEIDAIATRYLREIREVQPSGPYYLGGFSFGGRVAFTMAQRLRTAGETVAMLALFDTYALRKEDHARLVGDSLTHLRRLARQPWRKVPRYVGKRIGKSTRFVVTRLPPPLYSAMRSVFADRERSIPTPLRLTPREAHAMANRTFRPVPYDGDIVLFHAVGTPPDRHGGWRSIVRGRLEVHEVPGGHNDILGEPQVRVLAEKLGAALSERQARYGGPGAGERSAASPSASTVGEAARAAHPG